MKIKLYKDSVKALFGNDSKEPFMNEYLKVKKKKIKKGQIYFLVENEHSGHEKYIPINIVESIDYELPEDQLKKVVIFKDLYKLPPFWFVRLFQLQDIDIFCYKCESKNVFSLVDVTEGQYKVFGKSNYDLIYSYENLGKTTCCINKAIDTYDVYDNRESKELIQVAKEINNESLVKIVSIPINTPYFIEDGQGSGEYIQEYGHTWK